MSDKLSYKQQCDLYDYLCEFITDKRRQRFEEIITWRTRHITVVLEDIFQPHNASAVLRSCDCFGIQDVHIIENKNKYHVNPDVALGASNWLNLYKYNEHDHNTSECITSLKKKGYRIFAATPHQNDCKLEEIDFAHKTALLFGTEMKGLSEEALKEADGYFKIPMFGFTESFNISVSAALSLYSVTERLRRSSVKWDLDDDEKISIKIDWVKNTIKNAEAVENIFLQKIKGKKNK